VKLALLAATAILAAASLAAASAQDVRQTPGSNVAVTQCYPHRHQAGYVGHPYIDPYGIVHGPRNFPTDEGYLAITYANNAKVAAKEIVFGLVAKRDLVAIVKDVGTFSPGVSIDHEFTLDPELFPLGTALPYCKVLRIKYSDGSEWINPRGGYGDV